jgi:hypothetical protein
MCGGGTAVRLTCRSSRLSSTMRWERSAAWCCSLASSRSRSSSCSKTARRQSGHTGFSVYSQQLQPCPTPTNQAASSSPCEAAKHKLCVGSKKQLAMSGTSYSVHANLVLGSMRQQQQDRAAGIAGSCSAVSASSTCRLQVRHCRPMPVTASTPMPVTAHTAESSCCQG